MKSYQKKVGDKKSEQKKSGYYGVRKSGVGLLKIIGEKLFFFLIKVR